MPALFRRFTSAPYAFLLTGALLINLPGCGGDDGPDTTPTDLAPVVPMHNIHATVALTEDAQGVGVFAQNGVFAHIPRSQIVGKSTTWVILKGGEQIANGKMLEVGGGVIDDQLRSEILTKKGYPDGPFELSIVLMLVSTDVSQIPRTGDLASFDLSKPPAGEPPVTGTSVRVRLHGDDANLTLGNRYFIKL